MNLNGIIERVKIRLYRIRKHAFLIGTGNISKGHSLPVFVVGAQRSGTRIPMLVMEQSPDIIEYSEGNSVAFNGVLLKDNETLSKLFEKSPFKIVALKPICESHRALELLDSFPDSKIIWIFRNYKDTVNSCAIKWGDGRKNIRLIADGDAELASWRLGGLNKEKIEMVRKLYSKEMSSHAAHALMWYLRCNLYFDLELDKNKNVLLVKYEDLVNSPHKYFKAIFDFIECPFNIKFVESIFSNSVGKSEFPDIPFEIEALCKELYEKMNSAYNEKIN